MTTTHQTFQLGLAVAAVRTAQYELLHCAAEPTVHPDWLVVVQGEYNQALSRYQVMERQAEAQRFQLE